MAMKVCLAGEGAQGFSHYETLSTMDDVEVVSLAGGLADDAEAFAAERGIPHWSLDLEECLRQPGVEACILTTPNAIHAAQAELCMSMGKHVLIEIPMGMSLAESERLAELEQETGLVCMVCHSQRYGSGHREVKVRSQAAPVRGRPVRQARKGWRWRRALAAGVYAVVVQAEEVGTQCL